MPHSTVKNFHRTSPGVLLAKVTLTRHAGPFSSGRGKFRSGGPVALFSSNKYNNQWASKEITTRKRLQKILKLNNWDNLSRRDINETKSISSV